MTRAITHLSTLTEARPLAENLWLLAYPLKMLGADLRRNVTLIRLRSGKMVIHSTAPFSQDDVAAIRALGGLPCDGAASTLRIGMGTGCPAASGNDATVARDGPRVRRLRPTAPSVLAAPRSGLEKTRPGALPIAIEEASIA